MLYQLSSFDSPESLYEQCLHYLVDNWRACLTEKTTSENVELKKNVILPNQICEAFFDLYLRKNKILNCDFLEIFKNPKFTRLKRVNVRKDYYFTFYIKDFFPILHHDLFELHIENDYLISDMTELLQYLNENGNNLKAFSCNKKFFQSAFTMKPSIYPGKFSYAFEELEYVLNTPNLEKLAVRDFFDNTPVFFYKLITPLKKLTHLDITNSLSKIDYSFLLELTQLRSLTLHNVNVTEDGFKTIKKLTQLEYLDLSASSNSGLYQNPQLIAPLIEGLPNLISLDISGTNLDLDIAQTLKWRKSELQYLGLYKTYNNACSEPDIFAKQISGDANIKQLFRAGFAHFEREQLMKRLVNDFERGLNSFIEHDSILSFSFKVLDRHPKLAAECQALFKRFLTSRIPLTGKVKRHLIRTTMNMAIVDNSEIDVEFFSKWTAEDLFFDVELLMKFVDYLIDKTMEKEWAQVILYHILDITSESRKDLFGKYNVIKTLTQAIASIEEPYYFEWDFTWRCIRNSLVNSQAFVANHGLDLFTKEMDYLTEHSPESKEIMERELVVYLSLVQFESLANEYLMQGSFIWILSELLERDFPQSPYRPNNGPRVNYYAGCILLKLLLHESSYSAIDKEKREDILKNVLFNLEKWSPDLIPHCFLEEELLDLILSLFRVQHIPECRYWAVWGIYHFRQDVQRKYFSSNLEEGLSLLEDIVNTESVPRRVKEIAQKLFKKWSS